ncbi:unnamed protein product [Knipowitschia caucasica]
MDFLCFKNVFFVFMLRDFLSAFQMSLLPCRFTDEKVSLDAKGRINTTHIPRSAFLQFGLKDDRPVKPDAVTFLITPSKLDLRRVLAGAEVGQLSCELKRYSTDGSHVRWPVKGEHEYNRWFTVTISHTKKLFKIMAFIRQSTDQPPTGEDDFKSWAVIKDKEVLTTSVSMMMQTQTPVVNSTLKFQPKLHCQFEVDHKSPKVILEWRKHHRRKALFSSQLPSGQGQGSGVSLEQLRTGDASYTTAPTETSSEGTYLCNVDVHPLLGSLSVELQIQEPPHVSLNVDSTLTLSEDEVKRVVCEANGYYPLDVDIHWAHRGSTEVGPQVDTAQLSSHSTHRNGTYRLSAFFHLQAKLGKSGRKFTCSVSHRALAAPIRKTFTIIVTEPGQWILIFNVFLLVVVVVLGLRYCLRVRRRRFF